MNKKYFYLSDHDLLIQTALASQTEKSATLALLEYLVVVEAKKVYAIQAYSSLFEYLVKGLQFSESQASERINAMKLVRDNPEVKKHLESGKLNLTNAAKIQRFIQTEKRLASELQPEEIIDLVKKCLDQSKRNVDQILFEQASVPTKIAMIERVTLVAKNQVELKVILTAQTEEKLKLARELIRTETVAELLEKALDALIEKAEKKIGKTPINTQSLNSTLLDKELVAKQKSNDRRYIPQTFKKIIYKRSGGQCEYITADAKKRCESRTHLEIDHITPMAAQGKTELSNLRHLCRVHNAREAIEWGLGF